MNARIVPLTPQLLSTLVETERDPLISEFARAPEFAARVLARVGLSFAMLDGGYVVAGGGIIPHWHGRAEGWWLVSTFARPRHLTAAARVTCDFLDRRQRSPAFRRIEACVRAGERWSDSFIAALGFTEKSLMRAWDQAGRDYWLCARVAPEVSR